MSRTTVALCALLTALGVLVGTPTGYADGAPPNKCADFPGAVAPALKSAPGLIVATWSREGVTSGLIRWREAGALVFHALADRPGGDASWGVPGGHVYEVQLRVSCYDQTGPWSATVSVQVPRVPRPPATPLRAAVSGVGVQWTPSDGATSYVVKYRKAHRHHWTTRRVHGPSIHGRHISRARVRAINPHGRSHWRVATKLGAGY